MGDQVQSRRPSTVSFVRAPEGPTGVLWRHLHETFPQD